MAAPTEIPASKEDFAGSTTIPISVSYDWIQHRKYVLLMVFIAYFINSIDRNIIGILQQPIKEEFGLMDWQLGIMTGFAFALFYNLVGLPTARFVDGGAIRTTIWSAGMALWSIATALCGVAQNYWQLLLARAGVGLGEGTFGPCVVTMVSDYYGKKERARAIGTYLLGRPVAALIGLALGGWIAEHYGWRSALLIVGLPGVAMALLIKLTVKEPPRGLSEGKHIKLEQPLSIREVFATVTRKKTVVFLLSAASFASFCTVGGMVWFQPFIQRAYGLNSAELGLTWGIVSGLTGIIAAYGGGWVADKFGMRHSKFFMLFPAWAMLLAFPFFVLSLFMGNFWLCMAFLILPASLNNSWIPAAMSSTQGLAPMAMRGLLGMFVTLVANLIGHGFAPPVIGALSDLYGMFAEGPAGGLRWALFTTAFMYPGAAFFFWRASRNIDTDLEK